MAILNWPPTLPLALTNPPHDMIVGPGAENVIPAADSVGDRVAAVGERGERGVEPCTMLETSMLSVLIRCSDGSKTRT